MSDSEAETFLDWIWSGIDISTLQCCHCHRHIEPAQVLARTFTLESLKATTETPAVSFPVLSLADVVLIYHRHLGCLLQGRPYVTTSHVWHAEAAEFQYRRNQATISPRDVAEIVREVPPRICLGVSARTGTPVEVWHDYVSVPQWQPTLKHHILEAIPRLYRQSLFTVAHLYDIDPGSFEAMRTGSTVQERCRGISDICNSRWFTRIWTAMELTQSHDLRPMLRDFSLVPSTTEYIALADPEYESVSEYNQLSKSVFIGEFTIAWAAECKRLDSAHATEQMVGMGSNLVPWQLGRLELMRMQTQEGSRITFASAHELVARRCVTAPRDFFYAILGMLKLPGLSVPHISTDMGEALMQIAKVSLEQGDYSPLLMVPLSAQAEIDDADLRTRGFIDLNTFALGAEVAACSIPEIKVRSDSAVMTAELIGHVQAMTSAPTNLGIDTIGEFAKLVKLALDATGPSVRSFVETVGTRLYAQQPSKLFARLDEEGRLDQLRAKLVDLCNSRTVPAIDMAEWIAAAMGLSSTVLGSSMAIVSPLQFLEAHGGTLHFSSDAVVVSLLCPQCRQIFLVRAGAYGPNEDIVGATAYRFPGLTYEFTLEGGAGLLVKDGRTVGRLLWASPTCDCSKLDEFELQLEAINLPRQNRFIYGQQHDAEWEPVTQRKSLASKVQERIRPSLH